MKVALSKILKWIGRIFTFLLILILGFNVYIIVMRSCFNVKMPTVFGFSNAIVLTGSMEPTIHVNDMIIVKSQDVYNEGDIVTYIPENNGTPVTHRIIEKRDNIFITQGDANNTADPGIKAEQVVGRVVLTIPFVGSIVALLTTPLGLMIFIIIGIAVFGLVRLIETVKNKKQTPDE